MNSIGPSTDPCRTPCTTPNFMETHWRQSKHIGGKPQKYYLRSRPCPVGQKAIHTEIS